MGWAVGNAHRAHSTPHPAPLGTIPRFAIPNWYWHFGYANDERIVLLSKPTITQVKLTHNPALKPNGVNL